MTIGASMAGLLAAADHYDEVCLLERDTLPLPGEQRKGVPQGHHAHALLAAGREALERFFPGLTQELVDQGGIRTDIARLRWFDHGGYQARCTGIEALRSVRRSCREPVHASTWLFRPTPRREGSGGWREPIRRDLWLIAVQAAHPGGCASGCRTAAGGP